MNGIKYEVVAANDHTDTGSKFDDLELAKLYYIKKIKSGLYTVVVLNQLFCLDNIELCTLQTLASWTAN